MDREYESSSTGEDSVSESQRSRLPAAVNSHANVNGSVYVAQNGSIMRTRRSANTTTAAAAPAQTHPTISNNNLKFPSPVFSSRLAKHFKKLDKLAATLEERVPLNSPRAEGGCNTLRTFQSSRATSSSSSSSAAAATAATSFTHADNNKTPNGGDGARQSSVSVGSSSSAGGGGGEAAASKSKLQAAVAGGATADRGDMAQSGERESRVDGEDDDDEGLVMRAPLECPSDRTQSDEEELWMGPWNSRHIPMTKL